MEEIIAFLEQNKFGNLATCIDGKADIRPFELVFFCDRGMFFYTSAGEDVYEQLHANPYISFCATDPNYNYAKICGTVSFSHENEDKEKIYATSEFAKKVFAKSNLDNMKVFFLPHAVCMLHHHSDNSVVKWQF